MLELKRAGAGRAPERRAPFPRPASPCASRGLSLYALELRSRSRSSSRAGSTRGRSVSWCCTTARARGLRRGAPGRAPFYSEETLGSARDLITRRPAPRIAGRGVRLPRAWTPRLREKRGDGIHSPGGNRDRGVGPRGAIAGAPGLPQLVAEPAGLSPSGELWRGVALGIRVMPRRDPDPPRIRGAADGYRRVKIKVAPGWTTSRGGPPRAIVGTDVPLTVDANGATAGPSDEPALRPRWTDAGLLYIEQPLAPDELAGHARLRTPSRRRCASMRRCGTQDCAPDPGARRPDGLQLKVHRVGGLAEVPALAEWPRKAGPDSGPARCPSPGSARRPTSRSRRSRLASIRRTLEPARAWFGARRGLIKFEP